MADGTIKDTFEGELEEFIDIFEGGGPGRIEFARQCFATGAQCAVLLILKRIFHCKSLPEVPDKIESLHEEIEKWHREHPLNGETDVKDVNWEHEVENIPGMTPEMAKHAVAIGEELIKQLDMADINEPHRRYPKQIDGFTEAISSMQIAMKRDGISFTDSGKILISTGLASWACDVSKERLKNQ